MSLLLLFGGVAMAGPPAPTPPVVVNPPTGMGAAFMGRRQPKPITWIDPDEDEALITEL